jgi:putative membrane protein
MTRFQGAFAGGDWVIRLVSLAVWIAIVVGIVLLFAIAIRWAVRGGRDQGPPQPPGPRPDDPIEILRQRYARGEIDEEEYERRRKTLSGV